MTNFCRSLCDKDRRRYTAVEAEKLAHGGKTSIAKLFGCDVDTISVGRSEFEQLPNDPAQMSRPTKKEGRE